MPSIFYIRTVSYPKATCRVHGARSAHLGGQPVGHRKEPKTRKGALSYVKRKWTGGLYHSVS